jgi:hypothetical protein
VLFALPGAAADIPQAATITFFTTPLNLALSTVHIYAVPAIQF